MAGSQQYEKQRIVYLGPLGVGVVVLVVAAVGLSIAQISQGLGQDRAFDWGLVGLGSLGSCVGAVVATWVFNLVAPLFGGVRIWLAAEPAHRARGAERNAGRGQLDLMQPSAGTSERRQCPACGSLIRADRSFCPECGEDFGEEES